MCTSISGRRINWYKMFGFPAASVRKRLCFCNIYIGKTIQLNFGFQKNAVNEFSCSCKFTVLLLGLCFVTRGSKGFWLGGSMPPCRLRRRKFWKFDYEMEVVHSEVYLNKYVVSIAPFSTPACSGCSQNNLFRKLVFFACFRFLIFYSFFPEGQLTPFAPMCGRPCF